MCKSKTTTKTIKKNIAQKWRNVMIGIFNLNIGNNASKPKREITGDGVTFYEDGSVSGCEANFSERDYE